MIGLSDAVRKERHIQRLTSAAKTMIGLSNALRCGLTATALPPSPALLNSQLWQFDAQRLVAGSWQSASLRLIQ